MAFKHYLNSGEFINVSTDMSGKMIGMIGISTSVLKNELCSIKAKCADSICAHCYAASYLEYRDDVEKAYAHNHDVLTKKVYPVSAFYGVSLGRKEYRLESFSDVRNVKQALNYIHMAQANPGTTFAAWTKNFFIYVAAFKIEGKPANLILGISSPKMNASIKTASTWALYENYVCYIDFIFTVYEADFALWYQISINCGLKICATCNNSCYKIRERGAMVERNEILKNDAKRYYRAKEWIETGKPVNGYIFRDMVSGEWRYFVSNKKMRGIPGNVKNSECILAIENRDMLAIRAYFGDAIENMKKAPEFRF